MSVLLALVLAAAPTPDAPIEARESEMAVAHLFVPGFEALPAKQRLLAWHLALAAYAGRPIAYDQRGWRASEVKRLLEGIYLFGRTGAPAQQGFEAKLTSYLTRFYGAVGNHKHDTGEKFVPGFTPAELEGAARRALAAGADFGVKDEAGLVAWLAELSPTLFDPSFEAHLTRKAPGPGEDLLTSSANTAYGRDVTLADLSGWPERYPLNSRVVKEGGKPVERVFRAGTPDGKVPPGLYAEALRRVNAHLAEAIQLADPPQARALRQLVRYFQTGEAKDWEAYNIAWVKARTPIDANLGFIETYLDARGKKGAWEGSVMYQDPRDQKLMALIAEKAAYFERRLPWPDAYKRRKVPTPNARIGSLLATSPTPFAGVNLPNEQAIREKHGSKSVLVANVMDTASVVRRMPMLVGLSRTDEQKASAQALGVEARRWLVAFHEVLGHASGQVSPDLKGEPSSYLKEFDNTLEEARADLVALWHAYDPALASVSPAPREVAAQLYRLYLSEALTNLSRVEKGDSFEEDHQRGQHLIASYVMEKGGAHAVVEKDPADPQAPARTYWEVADEGKMRAAVGDLLSKLMVIKATGDYEGAKALIEKYGVRFDPKLRDEVLARVSALHVPTTLYIAAPRLMPVLDARGGLRDVRVVALPGFVTHELELSALGQLSPAEAARLASRFDDPQVLRAALGKGPPVGTR